MRYSYLEVFVEDELEHIDIRADNESQGYTSWQPNWIDTASGIKFALEDMEDIDFRILTVKIPETHHLFNFGILEPVTSRGIGKWTRSFHVLINSYGGRELKKQVVSPTLEDTYQYDEVEEQD